MKRFLQDSSGVVGLLTVFLFVTLFFAAGIGIDLTREVQFKTALQNASDAAALAGASVYVDASASATAITVATKYMNTLVGTLPPNKGVSFTATSNSTGAGFTVTVTASAKVATSMMSLIVSSLTTNAAATALNPKVTATIDFGGWFSSAADKNSIFWYVVPKDGSVPPPSAIPPTNLLFTNDPLALNKTSQTIPLSAAQEIGFAFENVTGGNQPYGNNGYGQPVGSSHWFFSQDNTLSKTAYAASPNGNCSLQMVAVNASTYSDNAPNQGTCTPQAPQFAATTCANINTALGPGQVMRFFWNDMGGTGDDFDYNDGEYNFSCSAAVGPSSVVLIR